MGVTRSALVTGATRGIGRAVAEQLARSGYRLTITARDATLLDETRAALMQAGAPDVHASAGDMGDIEHILEVVAAHKEHFGSMNALILAAGTGYSAPLHEYPVKWWDRQFNINTRASFLATREAIPQLLEGAKLDPAHGSRIISLASIAGVIAEPGLAAYGASKAANLALCRSICSEYAEHGLSATAIAPGYVDTDMSKWVRENIPQDTMITVADIATMVGALMQLSANAVVAELIVSRAGSNGQVA